MTKQEEILEGLDSILSDNENYQRIEHPVGSAPWTEDPMELDIESVIPKILKMLHNKGMVLKVERELPQYYCGYIDYARDSDGEYNMTKPIFNDLYSKFNENQKKALIEAGFTAVEPLIKE